MIVSRVWDLGLRKLCVNPGIRNIWKPQNIKIRIILTGMSKDLTMTWIYSLTQIGSRIFFITGPWQSTAHPVLPGNPTWWLVLCGGRSRTDLGPAQRLVPYGGERLCRQISYIHRKKYACSLSSTHLKCSLHDETKCHPLQPRLESRGWYSSVNQYRLVLSKDKNWSIDRNSKHPQCVPQTLNTYF